VRLFTNPYRRDRLREATVMRATLCVSAVFAVARCPSVRHVCVLYPDG